MAGPSGVDVINMLMEAVEVTGVFLTSTNHEKQSAALLQVPDIHSKVMLEGMSSSDHLFTLLFAFLPFKNFCRALWSLCTTMLVPVDSSSTYSIINAIGFLFCSAPFPCGVCECVGEKCNRTFLAIMLL